MIKQGGMASLYRGVSAPLVGVAPIFALSFAGNAAGQNIVRDITGHKKLNYAELFAGGMIAGVFSTIIMAPGERIKVCFRFRFRFQSCFRFHLRFNLRSCYKPLPKANTKEWAM